MLVVVSSLYRCKKRAPISEFGFYIYFFEKKIQDIQGAIKSNTRPETKSDLQQLDIITDKNNPPDP